MTSITAFRIAIVYIKTLKAIASRFLQIKNSLI